MAACEDIVLSIDHEMFCCYKCNNIKKRPCVVLSDGKSSRTICIECYREVINEQNTSRENNRTHRRYPEML